MNFFKNQPIHTNEKEEIFQETDTLSVFNQIADQAVVDFAKGKSLSEILLSWYQNKKISEDILEVLIDANFNNGKLFDLQTKQPESSISIAGALKGHVNELHKALDDEEFDEWYFILGML